MKKILVLGIALAGVAATTPLEAQMTVRNPASSRNDDVGNTSGSWYSIGRDANGYAIYERRTRDSNGNIVIQRARRNSNGTMTIISSRTVGGDSNVGNTSGSWYSVGRDASGYAIYERRTRDGNGNIVIQRARRNSDGTMTIISSRTVRSGDNRDSDRNRRNCDYTRSTNSVGDIIFGRTNDRVCDDEYSREDGGWYQVGRGPNNNSVYERRTRDSNGNLIIQRARRNPDGTMRILSTRRVNSNDKQWKKDQKERRKDARRDAKRDGRWESDRDTDRDSDDDRYDRDRRHDDNSSSTSNKYKSKDKNKNKR